ncbi:MAG: peptide deformylase [Candidatus Omnitrophota bacterium]
MAQLELKTYPDPCLRIRTKPVESFTPDIDITLKAMADLMYLSQGVGLAATQVGLGISLIVIDAGDGLVKLVNPEIVDRSGEKTVMEEGCLSLPGENVNIKRARVVDVRAQDENGNFFVRRFEALGAKAVQHEMDHINGKLITDYLDPLRRFIAGRRLCSKKNTKKSCEVVCHERK